MRGNDGFEDREGHQAPFTLQIANCRLAIGDLLVLAVSALWSVASRPRLPTLNSGRRIPEMEARRGLFRFLDRLDGFIEIRPLTGFEFGMEQFAIGANFEGAAARRNQCKRLNALTEFENLGRQTDGLRRVVSNDAVFD